jgi:hypothetical protein
VQLKLMLPMVAKQSDDSKKYSKLSNTTQFGVAKQQQQEHGHAHKHVVPSNIKNLRDNDESLHTDKQVFSCGSLAPKLKKKRGAGCMDHAFARPSEPWESSDGAIYLMRELAQVSAECAERCAALMPLLAEAVRHRHYSHHIVLVESMAKCLPALFLAIGKQQSKRTLESLLPALLYGLQCKNRLTNAACGSALGFLEAFLGGMIFRGRLTEAQLAVFDASAALIVNNVDIPAAQKRMTKGAKAKQQQQQQVKKKKPSFAAFVAAKEDAEEKQKAKV